MWHYKWRVFCELFVHFPLMKVVGSTETLGLLKTLYKYFYTILTRVTFLFLNMFPSPGYRTIFKTFRSLKIHWPTTTERIYLTRRKFGLLESYFWHVPEGVALSTSVAYRRIPDKGRVDSPPSRSCIYIKQKISRIFLTCGNEKGFDGFFSIIELAN